MFVYLLDCFNKKLHPSTLIASLRFIGHTAHPSRVYSSVAFHVLTAFLSVTTINCRTWHWQNPTVAVILHLSCQLSILSNLSLISICVDLPTLDISYKGVRQYVATWDWLLSLKQSVCQVHAQGGAHQYFISFCGHIIFHQVDLLYFILSADGHLSCFCLLDIISNVAINVHIQLFS